MDSAREIYKILRMWSARIVSFDKEQTRIAYDFYRCYGYGAGPRASLNYGNCAVCSRTRLLNVPPLFKGKDFVHTDIVAALPLLVPEAGVNP